MYLQQVTVDGQQEAGEYFLADHTYQATQTQTYSITASDVSVTGGCTISPGSYTFTEAPTAAPSECTTPYEQPASWDTLQVTSTTPGIANYIEPLNVIISACSTVPLSDIQAALGDWDTVYPSTEVTLDHAHIKCISPEEANVAGHGYVTEQEAWRYEGCREGNILSVAGLENHVRIWNQTVPGSNYGAWFITASYETACVSVDGELYPFANPEGRRSLDFFHCVDGGPGSYDTDGYDRGAQDFAHDVALAAGQKGWKVSEETITQPLTGGNVGEDGAPFDGTVYVLTVTQ